MNPQPTWGELESYYNAQYEAYDPMHGAPADDEKVVTQAEETGTIRFIEIPKGRRVLDVGCGGGWFLRICQKLGAEVQGVEPNKHAAEMTKRQGLNVFHGTLEDYVEQAGSLGRFDVVTANHVIEHTPNPVRTLQLMRSLLAPGGYIWIAVPNASNIFARILKARWHSTDLPYHLMQFSPKSMAEAGRIAGLKVRDQKTEAQARCVAISIRQVLRYRCMVPYRLAIRIPIAPVINGASRWYSERMDRRKQGEGLLTEFVTDARV